VLQVEHTYSVVIRSQLMLSGETDGVYCEGHL